MQRNTKDINHRKVRDHCHITRKYKSAVYSICNLKFQMPNEIPVVYHNVSNYDYHSNIKELANEFKGQFEYFGENKEKYKIFSVPIKK